jgi:hypothetical protein
MTATLAKKTTTTTLATTTTGENLLKRLVRF